MLPHDSKTLLSQNIPLKTKYQENFINHPLNQTKNDTYQVG